ncbi:MAG: hypothetical protein CL578_19430 [Alteromonadaceae bacterium]|uniref:hypothetical protein n=1 Tax=Paraglaciecola chathamensis TaxID=368405 RepID=UPI000C664E9D|nr:hypothetical protein [Paraglaciecola agarilytica]MBN27196.1 hypothetical protein [Alteromonadaceae bacterium]|tara:strand:+ start:42488 stop:42763 length:276 start_codon:yes stop_codon:yes gene_type:complete
MFTKTTIAAIALSSTFAFSSHASAAEVNLEQFVSGMMVKTIKSTKSELQYGIQEAVLTASNMFSIDSDAPVIASKITITDLNTEEDKDQAE